MITNGHQVVACDPTILGGAPVFVGTRVPVDSLLAHLKAGDSVDTFLKDFPSVSRELVEAYLDLTAAAIAGMGEDAHSPVSS